MRIQGGWLIYDGDDGYCRQFRIRLSTVTQYAYAETDGITIVWLAGKFSEELKGNHVAALDAYYAEHPDT